MSSWSVGTHGENVYSSRRWGKSAIYNRNIAFKCVPDPCDAGTTQPCTQQAKETHTKHLYTMKQIVAAVLLLAATAVNGQCNFNDMTVSLGSQTLKGAYVLCLHVSTISLSTQEFGWSWCDGWRCGTACCMHGICGNDQPVHPAGRELQRWCGNHCDLHRVDVGTSSAVC